MCVWCVGGLVGSYFILELHVMFLLNLIMTTFRFMMIYYKFDLYILYISLFVYRYILETLISMPLEGERTTDVL